MDSIPALLWIGTPNETEQKTIQFLQKKLCLAKKEHLACIQCTQIAQKQHPNTLWIEPEKQYTLENLEPLFKKIQFALDPQEQFFFILSSADFLSSVCANALLKSLEEPPQGYRFILLATRQHAILPTIQSRCVIQKIGNVSPEKDNPLLIFFTSPQQANPAQFLKIIDTIKPTERQTVEMIDTLLSFWINKYKEGQKNKNTEKITESYRIIQLLQTTHTKPIMPGSAKLFLKNLFLSINQTR